MTQEKCNSIQTVTLSRGISWVNHRLSNWSLYPDCHSNQCHCKWFGLHLLLQKLLIKPRTLTSRRRGTPARAPQLRKSRSGMKCGGILKNWYKLQKYFELIFIILLPILNRNTEIEPYAKISSIFKFSHQEAGCTSAKPRDGFQVRALRVHGEEQGCHLVELHTSIRETSCILVYLQPFPKKLTC